jgi:hypothetical protein
MQMAWSEQQIYDVILRIKLLLQNLNGLSIRDKCISYDECYENS